MYAETILIEISALRDPRRALGAINPTALERSEGIEMPPGTLAGHRHAAGGVGIHGAS